MHKFHAEVDIVISRQQRHYNMQKNAQISYSGGYCRFKATKPLQNIYCKKYRIIDSIIHCNTDCNIYNKMTKHNCKKSTISVPCCTATKFVFLCLYAWAFCVSVSVRIYIDIYTYVTYSCSFVYLCLCACTQVCTRILHVLYSFTYLRMQDCRSIYGVHEYT